ncbi:MULTISPECIES: hypothetical protein [unclassified Streptomyces]|uniref:hypothetical protein n=1 Tax=unclassified Streptomyces TaxID=2593676 RepID=UPI0035D88457
MHSPQQPDPAASRERRRPQRLRSALPIVLAVLAGLGGAAAVRCATRLTAARRRVHQRRARQVLAEQDRDEQYPWP